VPFQQAIVQSAITRAQPIVLTGLAAMLGAFFILDDPIFNGLAISLIFGIAVSTVLTLVVIPILYYMAYRRRVDVVRGGRRMMTMKYVAASALLVGVMAGFNAKATDLLQAWQAAERMSASWPWRAPRMPRPTRCVVRPTRCGAPAWA
jgi:hypothetical protein